MTTRSELWRRFGSKKFRKAFASDQLKRAVPFQIRVLRKKLGWSQERLAKESGLTQGVISRAEDLNYGNLTFNTVVEIAAGFDLAFVGKFVSFSELEKEHTSLSEASVQKLATFDEENQLALEPIAAASIPPELIERLTNLFLKSATVGPDAINPPAIPITRDVLSGFSKPPTARQSLSVPEQEPLPRGSIGSSSNNNPMLKGPLPNVGRSSRRSPIGLQP